MSNVLQELRSDEMVDAGVWVGLASLTFTAINVAATLLVRYNLSQMDLKIAESEKRIDRTIGEKAKELDGKIDNHVVGYGDAIHSLREHSNTEFAELRERIHTYELESYKVFQRRDSFSMIISEMKEAFKGALDEVKADVHKVEEKVDQLLSRK